jgi:hypothetical protein
LRCWVPGIQDDVIADVEVAVTRHAQAGTRAIDIVQAMLRKIPRPN